jgi:hypothetical protein
VADESNDWSNGAGAGDRSAVRVNAGVASSVREALGELIRNARRMRDGGASLQIETEKPTMLIEAAAPDDVSSLAAEAALVDDSDDNRRATDEVPFSSLAASSLVAKAAESHRTQPGETPALPGLSSLAAGAADAIASPERINSSGDQLSSLAALAADSGPTPQSELRNPHSDEVIIEMGDRRYRVRGLAKNLSHEQMKVTLYVTRSLGPAGEGSREEALHVDALNLCSAYQRTGFAKQAAAELGVKEEVVKRDIGKLLLALEVLQDEMIRSAMQPKQKIVVLTDEETRQALELLRDPRLLDQLIPEHFDRCGLVGEVTNKKVGYLAAVSRKLDNPLGILIQSSSAAGKSSLMEAVLLFCPEEDTQKYTAMTGQSLFYMEGTDLKHKILAIAEAEGAQQASYALKTLQSEGVLKIASTGKDPATGRLVTQEYKVEGPTMIFSTTTAIDVDEELLNRCIILTVDEDREQTRAIHKLQRRLETIEGLWLEEERAHLVKLHQNAQRLLRPLKVVNHYANDLTFLDDKTRTRRDNKKYLVLIRSIALLYQYQREIKRGSGYGKSKEYIEVTVEDIERANELANEVLGRSLDELPPQTRKLLMLIDKMVTEACERLKMERCDYRFSRRQLREYTGWSDTQLRVHMARLVEMEYLLVHRGGRGYSFVYELLYEGQGKDGTPFMMGLIDVEKLRRNRATAEKPGSSGTTAGSVRQLEESSRVRSTSSRGEGVEFAGPTRVQNGGVAGGSRGRKKSVLANENGAEVDVEGKKG